MHRLKLTLALLTVIFALQLAGAWALTRGELPPSPPTLASIPVQIGSWTMKSEQSLEQGVVDYLRPDEYIDRDYASAASEINLFIAYFKSVKSGYAPHSPAVCLPGAGWKPVSSSNFEIPLPGGKDPIPANQYLLEKDGQNILVFYWYQNARRVWSQDFGEKLYVLPDLLRYHRSDEALVRFIAPVNRKSIDSAKASMIEFIRDAFPAVALSLSAT